MSAGHDLLPPAVGAGTAFPALPRDRQLFWRTDLDLLCFYDTANSRWVTAQPETIELINVSGTNPLTATTFLRAANPCAGNHAIVAEKVRMSTNVQLGTTSTNYFTMQLAYVDVSATTNVGSTVSTQNDTLGDWVSKSAGAGAVIPAAADEIALIATETGTCEAFVLATLVYRRIVT